jgi:competence protein ComEC
MHPTYYKRPLFILLILYSFFLIGKKRFFPKPNVSPDSITAVSLHKKISLEGVVSGFPRIKNHKSDFVLKVSGVDGQRKSGNVLVRTTAKNAPLWRQHVKVTGELKNPRGMGVLGNFDWKKYLASRQIHKEMYVNPDKQIGSIETISPPNFFFTAVHKFRNKVLKTFADIFPKEEAAIISGIVLGEKTSLSGELNKAFRDSGAMHLLVASGSNVGFVTWLVYILCAWFGVKRRTSAFIALVVAGLYTLCAGADAPLLRAYIMSLAVTIGFLSERESGIFQGLVLAGLVILIFNPSALFQAGFQMSFLATFGIILVFSNFEFFKNRKHWQKAVVSVMLMTLSAQLTLYPLMARYFHSVSIAALFSNLVLVPLSAVIISAGFIIAVLAFLPLGWLLSIVTTLTAFVLTAFKNLVVFFASFDISAITCPSPPWHWIVVYYLVLFFLINVSVKELRKKLLIPTIVAVVLSLGLGYFLTSKSDVYMFSLGRNNSILVKTKGGKTVLINAGIKGSVLANAVLEIGKRRIDAIFLNSLNKRDWLGLIELSDQIRVGKIYIPNGIISSEIEPIYSRFKEGAIERIWPEEKVELEDLNIIAKNGYNLARDNTLWQTSGYSGNDIDFLSYNLEIKDYSLLSASHARVIRVNGNAEEFDIISRRGQTKRIIIKGVKIHVKTI